MCGKRGGKSADKKPPKPRKQRKCKRRDAERRGDDDTAPPTENSTDDDNVPDDVADMEIPDSGQSPAGAEPPPMSDAERPCYRNFMNHKLDEYEPTWVS